MTLPRAAVIIGVSLLSACGGTPPPADTGPKPVFGAWGVDLTSMDTTVRPGDNFFKFVNGKWLAAAEIPADRSSTGSFQDLRALSEKRMKEIMSELEAKPHDQLTGESLQLRDLYDAFLDEAAIETHGLGPVKPDLDLFAAMKTREDVARAMGNPAVLSDSLLPARISADARNSNAYVETVSQGGLALPERDYYLRPDASLAAAREAYVQHLTNLFHALGHADAAARASAVMGLETSIAKASWPAADRRDANKTYNPMTLAQLTSYAPGFPWPAYFDAIGVSPKGPKGDRTFVVRENTAVQALARLFAATPVPVWRDWLTAHYMHTVSPYLPKKYDEDDFAFFGKALNGQQVPQDRATRAVALLDTRLGHPLGKIYVAKYFPAESKARVEALVANLLKAYDADIRQIPWMTDVTRQKALDKLHAFVPHVGYPDRWRDYSGLQVSRDDLVGTVKRSSVFEARYRLDRLDQPVDRNEWGMTPPTINAYYTANYNSIFFPAAILQPPFFDPAADEAVNYGGIGAVIGHEISHGFDDQGSKYDGAGLLQSWWSDADRQGFDQRVAMLGAQYNTYEPLPGMHVNGQLTMGENIGDLSGLTIALKAYHIALDGKAAPVRDGFTGDQRLFLAFGQIWRAKYREGAMRQQVLSNPHSPPEFRVIGPTRNIDEWYAAFDVKPGDKEFLDPSKRVRLW